MSANRLNLALLEEQQTNTYRSTKHPVRIVHLGIGAFHRAHQAWYTDKVNQLQAEDPWYIAGVSLRSETVREQLNPQDGLFNVVESDVCGRRWQLVQSVTQVLVAPEDPASVIALMAQADTKIISLTVTEKGYCYDPATGKLNLSDATIVHDLNHPDTPKSALGFIVSSLQQRLAANAPGVTILCCDNLPNNGATLRALVMAFVDQLSDSQLRDKLAGWIAQNVAFPATMVDRIVPATTPDDIQQQAREGYRDLGLVKTERFSQWVIEDSFVLSRPAWEKAGVMLVKNVEPFEKAKLRLLNGAHSALAYLGFLKGHQYVDEVIRDTDMLRFLRHMMQREILPSLKAPEGLDLNNYIEELLLRFSNPVLHHSIYQIAMDGSQKLPQRLLSTIVERLAQQQEVECLCFAVAGWLRYTMAFDQKGEPIEVQDPYAAALLAIRKTHWDHIDQLVEAYLSFDKVFSAELKQSAVFRERVSYWLSYILANGVATALQTLLLEVQDYPVPEKEILPC
ncbi:MAG: mannitol dehydrogenase family protein [Cellvibrionaceae bacterium]|nr:mannitol dehydrogenase family protein [Cellvibrionaceae bacterium]